MVGGRKQVEEQNSFSALGDRQLTYKPGSTDGERDGAQVNRWQSQCGERERAGENAVTSLLTRNRRGNSLRPSAVVLSVLFNLCLRNQTVFY